jgi:hypothetical protein
MRRNFITPTPLLLFLLRKRIEVPFREEIPPYPVPANFPFADDCG